LPDEIATAFGSSVEVPAETTSSWTLYFNPPITNTSFLQAFFFAEEIIVFMPPISNGNRINSNSTLYN